MCHPLGTRGQSIDVRIPSHESTLSFLFSLSVFVCLMKILTPFPSSGRQEKNLMSFSLENLPLPTKHNYEWHFQRKTQTRAHIIFAIIHILFSHINQSPGSSEQKNRVTLALTGSQISISLCQHLQNTHLRLTMTEAHSKQLKPTFFLLPVFTCFNLPLGSTAGEKVNLQSRNIV